MLDALRELVAAGVTLRVCEAVDDAVALLAALRVSERETVNGNVSDTVVDSVVDSVGDAESEAVAVPDRVEETVVVAVTLEDRVTDALLLWARDTVDVRVDDSVDDPVRTSDALNDAARDMDSDSGLVDECVGECSTDCECDVDSDVDPVADNVSLGDLVDVGVPEGVGEREMDDVHGAVPEALREPLLVYDTVRDTEMLPVRDAEFDMLLDAVRVSVTEEVASLVHDGVLDFDAEPEPVCDLVALMVSLAVWVNVR